MRPASLQQIVIKYVDEIVEERGPWANALGMGSSARTEGRPLAPAWGPTANSGQDGAERPASAHGVWRDVGAARAEATGPRADGARNQEYPLLLCSATPDIQKTSCTPPCRLK